MNVEPIKVEDALEKLRAMGAVSEVQGGSRVPKYKHYLYEWLGVSKVESAVMIELLLRGAQTVGELRGRAARMEPIADVAELRPIVTELIRRGLVISLTPEGRGHAVTHALYLEQELEKVKREFGESVAAATSSAPPATPRTPAASVDQPDSAVQPSSSKLGPDDDGVMELRAEVAQLKQEVAKLKQEVNDIWSNLG